MDLSRIAVYLLLAAAGSSCSSEAIAPQSIPAEDAGLEAALAQDATAAESSSDALACDPPPWANKDAATDAPTQHEAGLIIIADGGDLEGGEPPPIGRTVCGIVFEPDAEPYDPCPNYGKVCCLLKEECYDPPNEPDFCLRPYCK